MKKIIALLLALTLCVGLFAGCDLNNTKPTEAPVTVDSSVIETTVLEERSEQAESTTPKRPRKRKADDNLFGGFDFDQEEKK